MVKKKLKKSLKRMTSAELAAEADRLVKENKKHLAELERMVNQLAAHFGVHVRLAKKEG